MTARFARGVVRHRWLVITCWLVVAVSISLLLPNVKQAGSGGLGDLVANDADAIDTEIRSVELFSFPLLSRTVVVEREPGGISRPELLEIYERSVDLNLSAIPGLESVAFALTVADTALPQALGEQATSALTYLFFPPSIGPVGRTGLAERLLEREVPAGRDAGGTGAVPARGEQLRSISDALPLVELITIFVVALAVGLHFRSLVAPLANVLTVAIAYLVAVRLVGGVGDAVGLAVPEEVEPVMVALLFGVVTDYVIFFLSRFRGHLREAVPPQRAAELTAASLTPIVFTAGISVAGAAAGLIVAQLGFFRAFGPGLAVAILIALAVVLTLVPALLAVLGRWALWPGGPDEPPRRSEGRLGALLARLRAGRERVIAAPSRRPLLVAALTAAPLIALTLLLPRLELANTLISGLPRDSPPKQTFSLASADFPPGAIAPTMILVEAPEIAARGDALARLERLLADRRNVDLVVGPEGVGDPPELGATVSPTGDAVRYLLVFDVNPFGAQAIDTVTRLRSDLDELLAEAGLGDAAAALAGDTALSEETVVKTEADLARVVPVAALIVFAVLAVFLRALVAPLYLVATSLLALGASLGLTVLVFQELLGYGELSFYVPFAGTVLLIALGSDYNVYLVGRIWAEARRRPLLSAIPIAASRATSAITIAGLVLALSFTMLALVPLRSFRELAFLLGAGLLIDAFVVRTLLAPALIALVGERSGWPGRALRRLGEDRDWKDGSRTDDL